MRKNNGAGLLCSVKPLATGFTTIGLREYCALRLTRALIKVKPVAYRGLLPTLNLVAHHPFQAMEGGADINKSWWCLYSKQGGCWMEKSARPLKKEVLRRGVSFLLACKKGRKEGKKIICRQVGKKVQSIQDRTWGVLLLLNVVMSQSWQTADFSSLVSDFFWHLSTVTWRGSVTLVGYRVSLLVSSILLSPLFICWGGCTQTPSTCFWIAYIHYYKMWV